LGWRSRLSSSTSRRPVSRSRMTDGERKLSGRSSRPCPSILIWHALRGTERKPKRLYLFGMSNPTTDIELFKEQLSVPLPVMVFARLTCGRLVRLTKDCGCITHEGPHWLHTDRAYREANRKLVLDAFAKSPGIYGGVLGAMRGFAGEERARLNAKLFAMKSRGISELFTEDEGCAIQAGGEPVVA